MTRRIATGARSMRRVIILGIAAAALALSAIAAGAEDWPSRPVRIVVPFAAGGAADTFGRLYADALSSAFGQQFYVENRLGAGGLIATEGVARAKPDGYTLIVSGIPTHVLGPAMNKNVSFDPMRDFTHIAFFGGAPNVFVVHPDFGARSLGAFMARARSESGGIEYVSAGFGTLGNWVAEYLAATADIKLVHVAYKGGANAVLDLIAGHVKVGMLTYSSVAEHIRAGALIPLAVTASARLAQMPEVPTFRELGYPELVATTWFALSGPAAMPADIVTRLNRSVVAAMERPQMRKLVEQDAVETKAMTAAEVTRYIQSEIDKWQPIIARMIGSK
ncbi:MAG: tripartite tricarboxylate transporter substrate binding protein [Xanthobacteraceae bacterium]